MFQIRDMYFGLRSSVGGDGLSNNHTGQSIDTSEKSCICISCNIQRSILFKTLIGHRDDRLRLTVYLFGASLIGVRHSAAASEFFK